MFYVQITVTKSLSSNDKNVTIRMYSSRASLCHTFNFRLTDLGLEVLGFYTNFPLAVEGLRMVNFTLNTFGKDIY